MQGKHVAITGPTAGIGRAASLDIAGRGAQLTLFCRSREKGEALQQEIVAAMHAARVSLLVRQIDYDEASAQVAREVSSLTRNPCH